MIKKLSKLTVKAQNAFTLIQFGTFVSMLLSAQAVARVGINS